MPPLPGSVWITNTVIAGEWEHLEDEARRGWFKEGFTSRNCLFGSDGRLHTAASFNAPELSLSGLFKRVMVHVRAAHEGGQAACSRDLAEAALAQLDELKLPEICAIIARTSPGRNVERPDIDWRTMRVISR